MDSQVTTDASRLLFYVRTNKNIYCIKKQRNIDKKEIGDDFKSNDKVPLARMRSGVNKEATDTGTSIGLEDSLKDTENSSLTSLISNQEKDEKTRLFN